MKNNCIEQCWECPFIIEDEDTGNRICGLGGKYNNSIEEYMEEYYGNQR